MYDATSDFNLPTKKSENIIVSNENISLPLITGKYLVSADMNMERVSQSRQKVSLPKIYCTEAGQPPRISSRGKENYQQLNQNKSSFAREMKEKLNIVFGGLASEGPQYDQSLSESDSDFETKIQENKEIMRQKRRKREIQKLQASPTQKNLQTVMNKKIRNQSLYELREKQSKNIQRDKKHEIKRQRTLKQKTPTLKLKDDGKGLKRRSEDEVKEMQRLPAKKLVSRMNSIRSELSNQSNKNDLFQSIQNYLQNPKDHAKQQSMTSLSLPKAKRELEEKLKAIEEKIGNIQPQNSRKQNFSVLDAGSTARNWLRVQVSTEKLECLLSNFDKQLERITSLQQNNQRYLQKYIEQQKMKVQLEFNNKTSTKNFKAVSN